jgi:hypothetical protein
MGSAANDDRMKIEVFAGISRRRRGDTEGTAKAQRFKRGGERLELSWKQF